MTTIVVTDEQLGQYARREHDLFRRLREGTLQITQVLDGLQCLIEGRPLGTHFIDLDAAPFIPDGWKVESHKKGGSFEWDPAKVALHLEPEQIAGKSLKGTELQKRLEGKSAFNANMLDWLLAHTEAIPEEWKQDGNGNTRYICFWDTVYRNSDGDLYVRCLDWSDGGWNGSCYYLDNDFGVQDPAAVRAS